MNFIRFVHLSAYFLPYLTTVQKTSTSLSKRHWECFMRAASFLLECALYELIYLYLNNVWSYRHGIRIWLSLVSNKPVTAATTTASFLKRCHTTDNTWRQKKQREHQNLWEHSSQQGGNPDTKSPTASLSSFCSLSCTGDLEGGCEVGCLQMFTKSSSYVSKATGEKMWQACLETHTGKTTE